MIRYALICDRKHEFESWFPDSATFDQQAKRALVTCPVCGSAKVEKAIMAPRIARNDVKRRPPPALPATPPSPTSGEADAAARPVAIVSPQERELRQKLKDLRNQLIKDADNVGRRFPEEARKMHYGEIEYHSIYGEASAEEARALYDEGIEFHPLPILPDDWN